MISPLATPEYQTDDMELKVGGSCDSVIEVSSSEEQTECLRLPEPHYKIMDVARI